MFNRKNNSQVPKFGKSNTELIRVETAAHLLHSDLRTTLLSKIQEYLDFTPVSYNNLCLKLIHNWAFYCQCLPETSNNYYQEAGGIIEFGLNRTEAALDLFKNIIQTSQSESEVSEQQQLWQYALFSAAVLQGIGKLQAEFELSIYNKARNFVRIWRPLVEKPIVGNYYSYELQEEPNENFRHRVNLLVAYKLMPSEGMAWISSNPRVLMVWLALLNEDLDDAGTLGAILIRANALAIQHYLDYLKKMLGFRANNPKVISSFIDSPARNIADKEIHTAVQFLQWFVESLASGLIKIHKAPLRWVPEGYKMLPEIFALFARDFPEYKNNQAAIMHSVLAWAKAHNCGYEDSSGLIWTKPELLLPEKVGVFNTVTKSSQTVAALTLPQQWHEINSNKALSNDLSPLPLTIENKLVLSPSTETPTNSSPTNGIH